MRKTKRIGFGAAKLFAPLARYVAIAFVILSVALVVFNVAANAYFSPKAVVDRELDALAREYYEDYLYPNLVSDSSAISNDVKHYGKAGVNTYLRQLLLYDSGRRQDAALHFNHKGYTCDRNQTYVKYYPDPPYGKKDYHFDVNLVCK